LINAKYGYPLSDYLMIGDAYADEKAAKNSGIDFFNVLTKEFIKAS
jgi:phosphoglycolate phosphatase-like HAD superfamily hydrolase